MQQVELERDENESFAGHMSKASKQVISVGRGISISWRSFEIVSHLSGKDYEQTCRGLSLGPFQFSESVIWGYLSAVTLQDR